MFRFHDANDRICQVGAIYGKLLYPFAKLLLSNVYHKQVKRSKRNIWNTRIRALAYQPGSRVPEAHLVVLIKLATYFDMRSYYENAVDHVVRLLNLIYSLALSVCKARDLYFMHRVMRCT